MKTEEPKPLVPFLGVPMIQYMLKNVAHLFPRPYLVVGHKADRIRERLGNVYHYIPQPRFLGTAHAVLCAKRSMAMKRHKNIVIIPGDHPLLSRRTLEELIEVHADEHAIMTVGTAQVPHFRGVYKHFNDHGRVLRDEKGRIERIIQMKDATAAELKITEINVFYYCFKSEWLWENIEKITRKNSSGEYDLVDLIAYTVKKTPRVATHVLANPFEGLGINTRKDLREVERLVEEGVLAAEELV